MAARSWEPWLLPIVFPLVMAIGGFVGLLGVPLPAVALGAAMLGVVLGSCRSSSAARPVDSGCHRRRFRAAARACSLHRDADERLADRFQCRFHGRHGPLHLCGTLIGVLVRWPAGAQLVRLSGVAFALIGA